MKTKAAENVTHENAPVGMQAAKATKDKKPGNGRPRKSEKQNVPQPAQPPDEKTPLELERKAEEKLEAQRKKRAKEAAAEKEKVTAGHGAQSVPAEQKELLIPLDLIDEPTAVHRRAFNDDELRRLENSIRTYGLLQPILVAKKKNRYEIVFGHRRFLATRNIGRLAIRAYVADKVSGVTEAMKFVENDVRDDLSQLEKAEALAQMKRREKCSNRQLAIMTGLSEQTVGQYLAMIEWPVALKDLMTDNVVSFTAARELAKITDEEALENYVHFARESGCTPRLAMQWRAEWEAQQSYLRSQQSNNGDGQQFEPGAEAIGQCFVTGEMVPYSQLTCIWIKPDVKSYLADVLRTAAEES